MSRPVRYLDCADCGSMLVLVPKKLGVYNKQYQCLNFPKCRGKHGAKNDGSPVGLPISEKGRKLRKRLHDMMPACFGNPYAEAKAHEWLRYNTRSGHIGQMGIEEMVGVYEAWKPMAHPYCPKDGHVHDPLCQPMNDALRNTEGVVERVMSRMAFEKQRRERQKEDEKAKLNEYAERFGLEGMRKK